jgi:chemotaxis protein methyltransferase CheR
MYNKNESKKPLAVPNVFTGNDFQKICSLLYQRAGISLSAQKQDMVYNRLSRRLRKLGLDNFNDYLKRLESDPTSNEWQEFINALTTNLTSFFREAYHFPILAQHALEQNGNYKVWCAAASSGEEPCSIAMTLEKVLKPSIGGPRIWATDIDTEMLRKASAGIYRTSDLNNLTLEQKRRYFLRGTGRNSDHVKVRPEITGAIHYQHLNLVDPKWDLPGEFDAIFCRNVMIYFDQPTQQQILNRFARILKPHGLLFVGHSEHFNHTGNPFSLHGQSVYRLTKEN